MCMDAFQKTIQSLRECSMLLHDRTNYKVNLQILNHAGRLAAMKLSLLLKGLPAGANSFTKQIAYPREELLPMCLNLTKHVCFVRLIYQLSEVRFSTI